MWRPQLLNYFIRRGSEYFPECFILTATNLGSSSKQIDHVVRHKTSKRIFVYPNFEFLGKSEPAVVFFLVWVSHSNGYEDFYLQEYNAL
jgi:hypothetical protein